MMPRISYVRPQSLEDAFTHLSSEGARLHAGGTDLLGCLREHVFDIKKIVSLGEIKGLKGIRETSDGGLSIGALTTITEVVESTVIKQRYPALAQAASVVATPQLRNQGTIGGNLCQRPRCWYYRGEFHCLRKGGSMCYAVGGENHYHCIFGGDRCYIVHPSDTAPALAALGAMVRIAGPKGARTVPLEEFFVLPRLDVTRETVLEPDEILTEILLPRLAQGMRSSYRKVQARRSWDFALAGVALALNLTGNQVAGARVFLSGAAPVPWRSKEVEGAIIGERLDEETVRKAADAVVRNAHPLEHNGYKIPLFNGIIEEELTAIARG